MFRKPLRYCALVGLVTTVGLAMSACSNPTDGAENTENNSGSNSTVEIEKDPELAKLVPEKYQQSGEFVVAVNPSSPPLKYLDDSGDFTGFTPDLVNAAAEVLGVKAKMKQMSFDALVPGLEAERFDVILSINDFEERRDQIDFIDYLWAGTAITGAESLEQDEATPDTLCGLSVGYPRGNVQQGLLKKSAKECAEKGEPEVEAVGFQDVNAGLLAVKSGQIDAVWGDATSMVYNANEEPETYKVLYEEKSGPYGVGVNKDNADLRDALREAMLECVDNGLYDQLLEKYGLEKYALKDMPLNEGPSNDD